jgi:hypothetical protein
VHNGVVPVWPAPPAAELNQTVPKVVKEQPDGLNETLSVPMNVFPKLAAAAAHAGAVVIGEKVAGHEVPPSEPLVYTARTRPVTSRPWHRAAMALGASRIAERVASHATMQRPAP